MNGHIIPYKLEPIYTLARTRTGNLKKSAKSVIINGTGTSLIDNPALLKRANKKVITNSLVLALVDIAKEEKDNIWVQKYWNAYHCQKKFIESNNKLYTDYCKTRWCATCCGIRKAELLNKYYQTIVKWDEPHLLTLTLKTVKANQLRERINDMITSFHRINDRCKKRHIRNNAMKIMGVKSLECNFNPSKQWYNPHFHIITPNRQTALYLKQEWKKEWNKNCFMASDKAQDVRVIEDVESGLIEVIKYGAKLLSEFNPETKTGKKRSNLVGLKLYARGLHNIYKAFESKQLFKSFGFQLPIDVQSKASSKLIKNYDVYHYNILNNDWVNQDTGEFLTGYEMDSDLNHLLNNSIDVELY